MPPPPLDQRVAELREQPGRTWGVPDALLAVVAVPAVTAGVSVVLAAGLDLPATATLVLASLVLAGCAAAVARRAVRQSGGWSAALGLDLPEWRDSGRVVGWTVLLVLAQGVATLVLASAVPALRDAEPQSNVDVLVDQPLAALLVLAVLTVTVAPVVEELLFRGVALRGLMLRLGFWPAALLSSLCFASLHVQRLDVGGVLVVAAIGTLALGLCLLTRRTGRLGPAIGVHALYNAGIFLYTVLRAG